MINFYLEVPHFTGRAAQGSVSISQRVDMARGKSPALAVSLLLRGAELPALGVHVLDTWWSQLLASLAPSPFPSNESCSFSSSRQVTIPTCGFRSGRPLHPQPQALGAANLSSKLCRALQTWCCCSPQPRGFCWACAAGITVTPPGRRKGTERGLTGSAGSAKATACRSAAFRGSTGERSRLPQL